MRRMTSCKMMSRFLTLLGIVVSTASFANAATAIYRSVGPENTSALADATSGNNLSISGSTAVFYFSLPLNAGVGDILEYDASGDGVLDSIGFIQRRINTQVYIVKATDGSTPTTVSDCSTWSLFRAYTSMSNALAGSENIGIDPSLRDFDTWSNGRDLVSANEVWHIACYADAADTTAVDTTGWTTGANNYLRIFAPNLTTEVGTRQRHVGLWSGTGYQIKAVNNYVIKVGSDDVRLEGLQIGNNGITMPGGTGGVWLAGSGSTVDIRINACLIRGVGNAGFDNYHGIWIENGGNGEVRIWNVIIDDFNGASSDIGGIGLNDDHTVYLYNNTLVNCRNGLWFSNGLMVAKNNIVQDAVDGYSGSFDSTSDYNLSDITADAPGSNAKTGNVLFSDKSNHNYHLAWNDTAAKSSGISLSADSQLAFTVDVDNETRTGTWDLGADQDYAPTPTPSVTSTLIATASFTPTLTATPSCSATPSETSTPTPTIIPSGQAYIQPIQANALQTQEYSYTMNVTGGMIDTLYIQIPTGWFLSDTPVSSVQEGVVSYVGDQIMISYAPALVAGGFDSVTFTATAPGNGGDYYWSGFLNNATYMATTPTSKKQFVRVASLTPTVSPTFTPSSTITKTSTWTPTSSHTPTWTPTATPSITPSKTATPSITPTWTPTITDTKTMTSTYTWTPTATPTVTPSATPSWTPTFTPTMTSTPTYTVTPTQTYSPTASPSITPSWTPTATGTFTETPSRTATPSITPTATPSWTPTSSATPSWTPTITETITSTPSSTDTPTQTNTPTATPSATPSWTPTITETLTSTPSYTATPTGSETSTATPSETPSATPSVTNTFSATPSWTTTITETITSTPSYTATSTLTHTPTHTPSVTPTWTPTETFTATPSVTNTLSATPSWTPTITETFTATPSYSATPTLTHTPTVTPSITGTWTPTATPTFTATSSFTITLTETSSATPTITLTITNTITPTSSWTPTTTPSFTATPSFSHTPTVTPTATPSYTETPSMTPSWTPTITETGTDTPTFTVTATQTASPTPTSTTTPIPVAQAYIEPNHVNALEIQDYAYNLVTNGGAIDALMIQIPAGWFIANTPVSSVQAGTVSYVGDQIVISYVPSLAAGAFDSITLTATAPGMGGDYFWSSYLNNGAYSVVTPTGKRQAVHVYTLTSTSSATATNSATPSETPTYTSTTSHTPTATPSASSTLTCTMTPSITCTDTKTATSTSTITMTSTESPTITTTATITRTATPGADAYIAPKDTIVGETKGYEYTVIANSQEPIDTLAITIPNGWMLPVTPVSNVQSGVVSYAGNQIVITYATPWGAGAYDSIALTATAPGVGGMYYWSSYLNDGTYQARTMATKNQFVMVGTATATATPTASPTVTPTWTITPVNTATPTTTITKTLTISATITMTFTPTKTMTVTCTQTPTTTVTPIVQLFLIAPNEAYTSGAAPGYANAVTPAVAGYPVPIHIRAININDYSIAMIQDDVHLTYAGQPEYVRDLPGQITLVNGEAVIYPKLMEPNLLYIISANDLSNSTVLPGSTRPIPCIAGPFAPNPYIYVHHLDLAPQTTVAGAADVNMLALTLTNPNPAGSAVYTLRGLTVTVEDAQMSGLSADQVLTSLSLVDADTGQVLATTAPISGQTRLLLSMPAGQLTIAPQQSHVFQIRMTLSSQFQVSSFHLAINDPLAMNAECLDGTALRVQADQNDRFPMRSGNVSIRSRQLRESYINYPNPFAAGRQSTSIEYCLEKKSRVSLKVFDLLGRPVAILLEGEDQPGGAIIHHYAWDGRNGSGQIVLNGLYFAVLTVLPENSSQSESLVLKIAVIK